MNLLKFLEHVDQEANAMSKGELAGFVHDMARTLPESGRLDFLRKIEKYAKTRGSKNARNGEG